MSKTVLAVQLNETLFTATFPCTIVGIRWNISILNAHAQIDKLAWALVVIRQGDTAGTLSLGDDTNLYTPEVNCLTYGVYELAANTIAIGKDIEGSTKTMRKMMGGDILALVINGDVNASTEMTAVIQFFCKT